LARNGETPDDKIPFFDATALMLTCGVTSTQNQPPQDKTDVPAALQSTTPDKPPIANVPEAATDVAGVPRRQTTGQAPKVLKRMGPEMDSAGDQRALPDEE
jgi:hypothetical protein